MVGNNYLVYKTTNYIEVSCFHDKLFKNNKIKKYHIQHFGISGLSSVQTIEAPPATCDVEAWQVVVELNHWIWI
jgi:hypothetical protein